MRVTIIGGGVTGVTTAYYLQQHGAEVTVLERAEGTGFNTGVVRTCRPTCV
ncbi:MAG: FAD-dependent oxidoreductase [Gammaproteobacteria bacterium]|nr:FAD-dependent oxidoreductase [Gammaproteobacteria bacterium]